MGDSNFVYCQLLLFIFSSILQLSFRYLLLLPLFRANMFLFLVSCRAISYCFNSITLEMANFHSKHDYKDIFPTNVILPPFP